jgi:magnesium transporter
MLLDTTLGAINIRQAAVVKVLSVVATIFLPPTLIASIYGRNFEWMPELHMPWGYPAAIVMMIASAVLPYWFMKWRGWL